MCVFCEIVNGNIPSKKIYEDDQLIAILDISQTTKGHTLIIPKKHYDNFLEMPDDELAYAAKKTQEIAKKVLKKLNGNGCNILINTNEVAGQTVKHVHFHIIPRYNENDTVRFEFKENKFDLDEILNTINN